MPSAHTSRHAYRLFFDHFEALERVHEERFEPTRGPPRPGGPRGTELLVALALGRV